MTAEKEYFIHLLASFLNGTAPKGENVDWQSVYTLAKKHNLCGILMNQIKLLPPENQPVENIKSLFNQQLGYAVQADEKRSGALKITDDFLNFNKIDHIFVKGVTVKNYYPVPALRTSGDIDVILRENTLDGVHKQLKNTDFKIKNYSTNVINVDIGGVEVELHSGADLKTPYFDNIFDISALKYDYNYSLSEYDELIYVICHLCKHLSYRGAGVRMLMDIDAMARGINGFDEEKLKHLAENAGVLQCTRVLLSLCKKWFNTPVSADFEIDGRLEECFSAVMLDGGSFGYYVNSIPVDSVGKSRLSTLAKLAFPSREFLKKAYPYYNKNKLLLLVARLNRLLDAVLKKRRQALSSARQVVSRGGNADIQRQLLTELGLGD